MMKITVKDTFIEGLKIIEPKVFGDNRGFFMETYNKKEFKEIGLNEDFVQDNHSRSSKGVLRGLHFQKKHQQAKLVRVIVGKVYDVAVDLRQNSETYGKYFGIELSEENKLMLFIPKGFAHGFLSLSERVEFMYKVTDFYCPKCDGGIIWSDKNINIHWPFKENNIDEPILSEKDQNLPSLDDIEVYL